MARLLMRVHRASALRAVCVIGLLGTAGAQARGQTAGEGAAAGGAPSDPADPMQLRATGRILYRDGKFEEALALYERALELNPGDPASYAYVATACFKLDNYTCAEEGYVRAITMTSQQPGKDAKSTIPFRSNLGGVYHRTNQFEKAVQTFEAAQSIVPDDESLAMNIKATIVDWHKFIMEQEIRSAASAEARRIGVQWPVGSSDEAKASAVKGKHPVSPFWDLPNLLRGRNYTEKAEVVFKEIVEQREMSLLPAALLLLRSALKDEPNFAIGCHLLADVAVRVRDIFGEESSAGPDRLAAMEELQEALFAVDPRWGKSPQARGDLVTSIVDEATSALRRSLPVGSTPSGGSGDARGGFWRRFRRGGGRKGGAAAEAGSAAPLPPAVVAPTAPNASSLPPKFHVVVVATELKDSLKLLHATATALGWEMVILGLGEAWRGLGSKVQLLDEYLSDAAGNVRDAATDLVLFVDAYDVLLLRDAGGVQLASEGGSSDDGMGLVERFLAMGGADGSAWGGASVVFSAEKTCAPDKGLELLYPATAPSPGKPFTFVNSGSYIGRVDAVRRMLAEVQADIAQHHSFNGADRFRLDDQRWFNRFYVRNHATFYPRPSGQEESNASVPIVAVDRVGSLFHTLHDVPLEAFRLQSYQVPPGADGGSEADGPTTALLPYSTVSGGRPCLVHGNGNGMDLYMRLSMHLSSNGWPPEKAVVQSSVELRKKYAPKLAQQQQQRAAVGAGEGKSSEL